MALLLKTIGSGKCTVPALMAVIKSIACQLVKQLKASISLFRDNVN